MLIYVPPVHSCPTCLTCLRAFVPLLLTCLEFFYVDYVCSFFYVPYVSPFFYVPYVPTVFYMPYVPSGFNVRSELLFFLRALRTFSFLRALRAFISYVPYVPSFFCVTSFFTCLTCLRFFTCLHFRRDYILLMYMLIKLTQINETTYKYFHFYKTRVIFCMTFSFFLKRKILITFNAKRRPDILKDWNIIWNEKFRES